MIFVILLTSAPFSTDTKNTLIPDFLTQKTQHSWFSHQNTLIHTFLTPSWKFWHQHCWWCWWQIRGMEGRVWRVPATLPYPDLIFTSRTLPGIFLKISGFRVVSKYHFQCRIISMTLISQGKWPFTRLINFQNFPHPSDRKTFVTKWSMGFPQQLNTTIIIWRSAATSPDILVVGDDDGDTDTFDMQNTYWQSRLTLPATLPVTRIFSHYPTRTLPEVKKPYPSQPA